MYSAVVADGYLYVGGSHKVRAYDLSDPARPLEVDAWHVGLDQLDVAVGEGRAYASVVTLVDVIDVSAPEDLGEVGMFDAMHLLGGGGGMGFRSEVAAANGYVYFAWHWGGLSILRFAEAPTYSISGQIQDTVGEPVPGVTVSLSTGESVVSGPTGAYTLTGLITGTYTLTPTLAGWTFTPPTRTVTLPPSAEQRDFVGAPNCVFLDAVEIDGSAAGYTGHVYAYTAIISPTSAVAMTYTWTPEPASGQGTATAAYKWPAEGEYMISLEAQDCAGSVSAAMTVTVVSGQVETPVEPGQDATLVFTDTQGSQTTVEIPGEAVSEAVTLVLTAVETPTVPSGFAFAGHAFTLEAYSGDDLLPGFLFETPVTLTIEYTDADVAGLDENTLELHFWDGIGWSTDGIVVVERDTEGNRLVALVDHLSQFALLVVKQHRLYLPLVLRSFVPNTTKPCEEAIANGGFESDSNWERPVTAYRAQYSTAEAHTGSRSMRVGIVDAGENKYSYSSARQWVTIPAGAASVTLGFWLYPVSGDPAALARPAQPMAASPEEAPLKEEAQYALILDENEDWIDTLLWQRRDDGKWIYHEADLTDYVGQMIGLHFGVFNDGQSGVTGMYVDDVSLTACPP
jgi:hypothetical protein